MDSLSEPTSVSVSSQHEELSQSVVSIEVSVVVVHVEVKTDSSVFGSTLSSLNSGMKKNTRNSTDILGMRA